MRFRRHQEAAQAGTRRLLALFALVVAGLVAAVNLALALAYRLTAPWASGYPDGFFTTNTALVLLYVLGGCAVESLRLRAGGAHVARLAGGREANRDDPRERRLANVVAEVAIAANTKPPTAWVLPREDAINAFAAGWGTDDAVVAVTRGALERLDRAELQGVVAHELSHLVHGDTTLNMRLIGMVWGLRLLFDLGRALVAPDERGRRHAGVLFGVALIVVGALGWAAGRLLQAAVSRQREFLADASAVRYTRQVAGLGGALRKIAEQQRTHDALLSARTGTLAHLFLVSSSDGHWWATHPPLAERIRRLYGRPMPGLAAEPLPAPGAGDEPPATTAFAPRSPAAGAAGATPVDAALHDPVQRPQLAAAARRRAAAEAEAIERLARRRGPGEMRLALHALLRPAAAASTAIAATAAGQALPAATGAAIMNELAALGPAARAAVFDAFARRAAAWSPERRRVLLDETRRVATTPGVGLRWLLLRHRLRERRLGFAPPMPRHALEHQRDALVVATLALADALGADTVVAAAWARRARHTLGVLDLPAPRIRPRDAWHAVVRLQRLAGLQRPLPVRAWVGAWADEPALAASDDAAAALALAARLLEAPLPPALAARLPDFDATDEASGGRQPS